MLEALKARCLSFGLPEATVGLLTITLSEQFIDVLINELVDKHHRVQFLTVELEMLLPGEEAHLEEEELLPLFVYFFGVAESQVQRLILDTLLLILHHGCVRVCVGLAGVLNLHIGYRLQPLLSRLDYEVVRFLQLARVLALGILYLLVLRFVDDAVLQHRFPLPLLLRVQHAQRDQQLLLEVRAPQHVQAEFRLEREVRAGLFGEELVYDLNNRIIKPVGNRILVTAEDLRDEDLLPLLDVQYEYLLHQLVLL